MSLDRLKPPATAPVEFRRWTASGWGEWMPSTDHRVPVGLALMAVDLAALGARSGGETQDRVSWQWRVTPPTEGGDA